MGIAVDDFPVSARRRPSTRSGVEGGVIFWKKCRSLDRRSRRARPKPWLDRCTRTAGNIFLGFVVGEAKP